MNDEAAAYDPSKQRLPRCAMVKSLIVISILEDRHLSIYRD